jgi:rSAM/selenodomain-associated transferase 1
VIPVSSAAASIGLVDDLSELAPLALEQEYREHWDASLFDLSSSSPVPYTLGRVLDAASADIDSLLEMPLNYCAAGGDGALREAIASLYEGLGADDVLVTAGASEAIRVIAMAAVRPSDTVVMQSPCYPALREAPAQLGADVLAWKPGDGFQFDFGDLRSPDLQGASAVFLNAPHGPSGTNPHGDYDGTARLIADEVYRPIELVPGTRPRSVVDRYEGAVSIGDLSKPLGLGGLRIGWLASRDRGLLRQCAAALDYLSGSISTLSARVALFALQRFEDLLEPQLARARRNLSTLSTFLESHAAWLDWTCSQAGYTAFVRYRSGSPDDDLYSRLRERGVFALSGQVYGEPDHVRIGFGLDSDLFSRALEAFSEEVCRLPAASIPTADSDVILLAKEPRPGFSKTRLAAAIGAEAAASLSDTFLRQSISLAQRQARRLYVSFAPSDARETFKAMAPEARLFAQPEGDLGQRLLHAFDTALADGARRPVLIGSDSPTLPSHLLRVAQRLLQTHDVVLGPAEDGGYYLIGMNAPHAALFHGVDWGRDAVLRQTLGRAAAAGLTVATLPYWYDIDTAEDLARLGREAAFPGAAAGARLMRGGA